MLQADADRVEENPENEDQGPANLPHAGRNLGAADHSSADPEADPGWVYFIRCMATNLIKIGHTAASLKHRLSTLQVGSGSKLLLVGAIKGDRYLESRLHDRFADLHVRGDWFHQSPELHVFICRNVQVFPDLLPPEAWEEAVEFGRFMEGLGVPIERYFADILSGVVGIVGCRV